MSKLAYVKGKKAHVEELGRDVTVTKPHTYFIKDIGGDYHTSQGVITKAQLKKGGRVVVGTNEFSIIPADFLDLWLRLERGPQIMTLKDIGYIIAATGMTKNSVVVDAGTGSGAVACYLAQVCKKVVSYDIEQAHTAMGKRNAAALNIKNITFKTKDVTNTCAEKNVDVMVIDIPEPALALDAAKKSLRLGGYFVGYTPCVPPMQDLVNQASEHDSFVHIKTVEVTARQWKAEGNAVRPKSGELSHTAFLTILRKVC